MANPTIYDRTDPSKPVERVLFRPDRILQSAELMDTQGAVITRVRDIADVLFADGDVVRGAGIVVNQVSGETTCEDGAIYAAGAVRGVPSATIEINVHETVSVGVYMRTVVVTEIEDPSLYNPAVGTRGFGQPGAAREYIDVRWGHQDDGQAGSYFPIWLVENGIVRPKDPPATLSAVTQALERYDRDSSGGTYIVRGLSLMKLPDLVSGEQVYSLAEGAARVGGKSIELPTARRLVYDALPDLQWIDSEPHQSVGEAAQRIDISRWPMIGDPQVRITARRTVSINHGGFTGAADALPDESVIQIDLVKQGATTYTPGADYLLTAGQMDWSPSGAEPAPGSTYEVTYRYMANVAPTAVDARGFTVTGALAATPVLVSYNYALRRIDRLCLHADGSIAWSTGTPATWTPVPPQLPPNVLALASVNQFWDERRTVRPDGDRMVTMSVLGDYADRIDTVKEDLAELRLAVDVQGRQSGVRKGLFADPFLSDAMRDAGQAQTAVVVGGALVLPVDFSVFQVGTDLSNRAAPAHTQATVLDQPLRTDQMLVNPYQAFDPLPAGVVLTPAVDRWSESVDTWASPVLDVKVRVFYMAATEKNPGDVVDTKILAETTSAAQFLRTIDVTFDLSFPVGEALATVLFDGLPVVPSALPGGSLVSDSTGHLRGKFTIPAGVPAGTKQVTFTGTGGTTGGATFTGQGSVVHRELQQITTRWWFQVDPLAQTFSLNAPRQVSGVELRFVAKGTSRVLVQLRTAENGFPTQDILTQAELKPADINISGPTQALWAPVQLGNDREYAIVVLSDDAVTALGVAVLGKRDIALNRDVTSQPYQVGVLLSSSNASTWTPHQDRDMTFRLLGPAFTEAERVIDLGAVEVVDATDLLVQGFIHQPSPQASGEFELSLSSGETHQVAPGQAARLSARYSGPVQVRARLRSHAGMGAVLEPGIQLVACDLKTTGTYITPLIGAGANVKVRVIFEADLPAGTTTSLHVQADTGGAWTPVPFLSSSPQSAGTIELTHELPVYTADRLRLRLSLGGSHNARPVIRNLRAIVL